MNPISSPERRKQLFIGLLLIGIGSFALLGLIPELNFSHLWHHYWPFIFAVWGVYGMLFAANVRDFSGGLFSIVFSIWLYVSLNRIGGLGFNNSWPILLIGYGVKLLIDALFAQRSPAAQNSRGNKE